jgi:hypothetical protein
MPQNIDITDLGLDDIILGAIDAGNIILEKGNKLRVFLEVAWDGNNFAVLQKAEEVKRQFTRNEMVGGEITFDEWENLLNLEIFQTQSKPGSTAILVKRELESIRSESRLTKDAPWKIGTTIKHFCKSQGLPYSLVYVKDGELLKPTIQKMY